TPVGRWLGAPMDKIGRVVVRPDLSVPDLPNVFVIGDAAYVEQGAKPLPGVAPVAMQQGRYVGRLLRARLGGMPFNSPFHYRDKGNLATIGRGFAILDLGWLKLSGFVAWIAWVFIHIWYLIGFRNRISVMLQWAWAYFTYRRV